MRLLIVFLFFAAHATSQEPRYSHYKWFKVEDGLPQSFVSALVQDNVGFLWIGTRDGLARYDGREFRIFHSKLKDSTTLQSNVIIDLFLDSQNLLWVFYVNEKVDCFDPRRMQVCYRDSFTAVRKLLTELKIKKFTRDRTGRFWFNTSYKGIVCYDPRQDKTTRFDSLHGNLRSNNNLGVVEAINGNIYAFTDKGTEHLSVDKKRTSGYIPFDPSLQVKFIRGAIHQSIALPDGRVAISDTNRLIIFDPVRKKYSACILPASIAAKSNAIQHLQVARDGLPYIVAAGGSVYRLEKNNEFTWIWQARSENPFANDAKSFLIDQSMVMWLGTNAAGMYKINLASLPFNSSAYNINFTSDILSKFLGPSFTPPATIQDGKWAYGLRYCYDGSNSLWLTQKRNELDVGPLAVYKLAGNKLRLLPPPANMSPVIRGLSTDRSGAIYGIDLRGNIWKWDNDAAPPSFSPAVLKLPPTVTITDMVADNGIFWVTTDKGGLFKINNNQVLQKFTTELRNNIQLLPTNQLTTICKDPGDQQILWIGTLGYGLIRLEKNTGVTRTFTTTDNLPNNTIYSIVPDREGNLWISTNNGISRFSKDRSRFYNFDVRDGLVSNEFNRFHGLLLPDNRIAFGGPDGYSVFDPSAFRTDSFPTKVELTNLFINNQATGNTIKKNGTPIALSEVRKLTLPYNQNFLQFEFAGLQFNEPEKLQYRYMLKGYDKNWIMTGNRNIASYTKLPPGRYELLLNASNTAGNWSPEIRQVAIRIRPPLWATWWAYTIYGLIVLWLLWAYWRYRNNRLRMQNEILLEQNKAKHLKEVEELKDHFFSNITHELRTPLTLILTPLEKLRSENRYSPADQLIISNAYKNAEQLLRLINQLLDISKIESGQMLINATVGDLTAFVERCVQQFSIQAEKKDVQLQFINKNVNGHFFFDEEKWEKIIFNLLGNAIKFTSDGGRVDATLEQVGEGPMLRFSVTDTGKGISEDELSRIFDRFYMIDNATGNHGGTGIGLALVKELTALMHGTINVSSQLGKGSCFSVEIPIEKATTITQSKPDKTPITADQQLYPEKKASPLVLVAEDNEELCSFIVASLSTNWRVLHAPNGKEAWEMVLQELPDIIISDVMMPEMDGYELSRLVKEDPRTGHISVILLTAKAAHESRLTGLKSGADEYLTKPFHWDELEVRLQNLVLQQERLRNHLRLELLPATPLKRLPHVNDLFIRELYVQLDAILIHPDFSVEALAQRMAMSQRTLNRKLKAILNITPVEFIRRYRLQKAAIMLSSGHSISDAAYSVGFDTASYFTQCFKEEFGKTPTEFLSQKTA